MAQATAPLPQTTSTRLSRLRIAVLESPGLIAVAITLLALALRLYRLDGRSLWLDEIVTAHSVRFDRVDDLLAYVHFWYDNMPGVFLLTWLDRGLGGSEIAVRLPFVLAGAANVYAIYALGKTLIRPRVGLVAALLFALLPFAVWYSQEARQYAFLMLFTTLQMLYAYRLATAARPLDAAGLAITSILNVYFGYLALPVTAASFAFLAFMLFLRGVAILRDRRAAGETWRAQRTLLIRQSVAGVCTLAAVALAYLPWLPTLREFAGQSGSPIYRNSTSDLSALLGSLYFQDLLLVLLELGIVTTIIWTVRGRLRTGLLIFAWVAGPLTAFWITLQEGIFALTPRYFACIFPALVLLVTFGIEGITTGVKWLHSQLGRALPSHGTQRWAITGLPYALLLTLVLWQVVPALARSYDDPKDDYRGAVDLVSASSPNGVVLVMHSSATFTAESLQYYVWLQHADVSVANASRLDLQTATQIARGNAQVWAADFDPARSQSPPADLSITHFGQFALLRDQTPGAPSFDQALQLLQWGSTDEPRLQTTIALLNALQAGNIKGANLLPPATKLAPPGPGPVSTQVATDRWLVGFDASSSSDYDGFHLTPDNDEVNVTLTTRQLQPGHTYALSFRYRHNLSGGAQRVYVSAHDDALNWLDTFPDGLGYDCPSSQDWAREGFAFTLPTGTTSTVVWLRATGQGTADFSDVELQELP